MQAVITLLSKYIVLPQEVSSFERRYLTGMNQVAFWFFVAHLPIFVLLAAANDTGPVLASFLTLFVLIGPLAALFFLQNPRSTSLVMGVTAMFMGGLLVHFGQGPAQIEMHFYFFVLLALLAVFANPLVIIVAAFTAAFHHTVLWAILPNSVFNYEAPFWVVTVHAAFVILESIAACFIARSFFDNVVGLEKIVAERTIEVSNRNRDMRRLLDAASQGFFTIDSAGVIGEEQSLAVRKLLGQVVPGQKLTDILRSKAPKTADWLSLGLDDVFAGILPVEVAIDQLPKRIKINDKIIAIDFQAIYENGRLNCLFVVLSDISADVQRELLEAENRELSVIMNQLVQDKDGLLSFFREAESIVQTLRNYRVTDSIVTKRFVHTLKGNCAVFGLNRVAQACHEIEDYIAGNGELPDNTCWDQLFYLWNKAQGSLRRLVREEKKGVTVRESEYRQTLNDLVHFNSHPTVIQRVAKWQLEDTQVRMLRIADQARALSQRLGKGDLEVTIVGGHLKTDGEYWGDFWASFLHVVRNAIDHGIEPSGERLQHGKPARGQLTIKTDLRHDQFIISLRDDGRGIDWNHIAALAAQKGLPCSTQSDLVEALFVDGLSTSETISEISGRGVGMSAVRQATRRHNGQIHVESIPSLGTTIEFQFPMNEMFPTTSAWLKQLGIENLGESRVPQSQT
ncbi:ATP-binding protein [Pirellulaceae bacterium SH449]